MLASFLCGEFLLHIPCWFHFYLGSFSYTSHASFTFLLGVSLTHPMLPFLYFNLGSFSYKSCAGFSFIWWSSFKHPVLALILCGEFLLHIWPMLTLFLGLEFLLHIPCWLHFYVGSFFYTSRAGFTFIWVVSLTHSMLALLFCGEFLLHIPCCLFKILI